MKASVLLFALFGYNCMTDFAASAQSNDCKLCREDLRACLKNHSQGACKSEFDICVKHCQRK